MTYKNLANISLL